MQFEKLIRQRHHQHFTAKVNQASKRALKLVIHMSEAK